MSYTRNVFKNTSIIFLAQIISYILGFFITMYTARYLGTSGFGILSLALAITGIFGIFTDLGLSSLTVRDVARDKSIYDKYVFNITIIKILLAALTFGLIALLVTVVNYSPLVTTVIYLITISVIINAFTGIFNSIFQANEQMKYLSFGLIFNSAIMFIGTMTAVYYQLDITVFAFIYLLASLITFFSLFIFYLLNFSLPSLNIDLSFWKSLLGEAWPFGLNGLFSTIFVWVDTFILSLFQGNDAVGIYNASYRLIMVMLIIPVSFNVSIFPIMSKFFVSSEHTLKKSVEKYFKIMIIIGVPLAVGITLIANKVILLVYGPKFEASTLVLQIIIWSTLFIFLNSPFTQLLQSVNKQMVLMRITAICMVENIILNLILIRQFSYIGSSIVTVITEFSVILLVFLVIRKMEYGVVKKQFRVMLKVLLASLVMGISIIYILKDLNLAIIIILATLIYFVSIYFLRVLDEEDLGILKELIKK